MTGGMFKPSAVRLFLSHLKERFAVSTKMSLFVNFAFPIAEIRHAEKSGTFWPKCNTYHFLTQNGDFKPKCKFIIRKVNYHWAFSNMKTLLRNHLQLICSDERHFFNSPEPKTYGLPDIFEKTRPSVTFAAITREPNVFKE